MFGKLFWPIKPYDAFDCTQTQLPSAVAWAAPRTPVFGGAGCAICQCVDTHHLLLTTSLLLLSELAYDLDMDDIPANKQLLNQQSKDGAAVPSSDPGSVATHPSCAAAIALVLLLLLGHQP